jgi:GT2 family glycosyltransferase
MKTTDVYFVTATKKSHDDFWQNAEIAKFLRKAKIADQSYIAYNNSIGLSDIYNHAILNSPSEYVVLVHDDVVIEDIFWLEKLEEGFKECDILGLAGATNAKIKSPAMWHLMSERQDYSGFVNHYIPNQPGKSFATSFGISPQRCVIMDGLFLAVKRSKLMDKGLMFNPDFKFHHYDIDFCLQANKKGLKMTTIPLHVTHASGGESGLTQAWKDSEKHFLQLYN